MMIDWTEDFSFAAAMASQGSNLGYYSALSPTVESKMKRCPLGNTTQRADAQIKAEERLF